VQTQPAQLNYYKPRGITTKMKALYIRNSTTEERQNPLTQINPLVDKCKKENWDYVIFQEFASGAKESRPELDKMMSRIRQGEFDAVMVWRLDRLGRSLKHLLQLIEEFKKMKVSFISLTEGFDTGTPQGELFFHIAGAFAQFERRLIQERINAGLDRARGENKQLGRPKGSKDKKIRRKSGYWQRWTKKETPHNSLFIRKEKEQIKQSGDYLQQ
jgi:DNA invertase Pin-like site-specific DNA recombinase